jgi:hypothetical protein
MLRIFGVVMAFGILLGGQVQAQDQPATASPPVLDLHGQLVSPPNNPATYSIEYYASKGKKIIITGRITDSEGIAISKATVSMSPQLGSPIFTVSTNEKGSFTVIVVAGIEPPRLLYLRVEGIGYSTMVMPMVPGGGQYIIQAALSPYMG